MHRAFLNVGYELTEKELRTYFVKFGLVSDIYLPKHPTGRNKGFGFVTFDSTETLERVLLTPHTVNGVVLQVQQLERQSGPPLNKSRPVDQSLVTGQAGRPAPRQLRKAATSNKATSRAAA